MKPSKIGICINSQRGLFAYVRQRSSKAYFWSNGNLRTATEAGLLLVSCFHFPVKKRKYSERKDTAAIFSFSDNFITDFFLFCRNFIFKKLQSHFLNFFLLKCIASIFILKMFFLRNLGLLHCALKIIIASFKVV